MIARIFVVHVDERQWQMDIERLFHIGRGAILVVFEQRIESHLDRRCVIVLIEHEDVHRARVTEWVHLTVGHFHVQLIGLVPFVIQGLSECQHARVSVQTEETLMVVLERVGQFSMWTFVGIEGADLEQILR